MKYVICVPDGCADLPVPELDGRTPLEAAHTPHLDALAARATVGRAAVIPDGMPSGSDVGNMSIFGFDPAEHHTGRAPIEAAALGLSLSPDQAAFRCNLVTVSPDGVMLDYAGGNPSSESAAEVIATKLFHAIGYHTPENHIVRVHPDNFLIEPGTTLEDAFGDVLAGTGPRILEVRSDRDQNQRSRDAVVEAVRRAVGSLL